MILLPYGLYIIGYCLYVIICNLILEYLTMIYFQTGELKYKYIEVLLGIIYNFYPHTFANIFIRY